MHLLNFTYNVHFFVINQINTYFTLSLYIFRNFYLFLFFEKCEIDMGFERMEFFIYCARELKAQAGQVYAVSRARTRTSLIHGQRLPTRST